MGNMRRYIVTIAVLVIFACAGVLFYTVFHDGGGAVVPQLVGMSLSEASDTLSSLGLSAKVERVDSSEAQDTVVAQDIKPGTKLKEGKTLLLQVSSGGRRSKIPDVRLMKNDEAVRMLEQAGFKVTKTVRVADSERSPGTVLAQNPCGGQQVDTACGVELLICAGDASEGMVYVPDVRGKTAAEAEVILGKSGLELGEKTVVASAKPEGTVISTKPGIGARVASGVAVAIAVADGKGEQGQKAVTADATKESAVKAVKAEPKPLPEKQPDKKVEAKAAKTDKKEAKETAAKPAEKAAQKAEAKNGAKTVAKPEQKQEQKSEVKAEQKSETKAEGSSPEKKADTTAKSAKVRYVVPPLAKPMSLKILLQDEDGNHVLKDMTAQGNEVISVPVRYKGKATLSILLGGETVWQESYK